MRKRGAFSFLSPFRQPSGVSRREGIQVLNPFNLTHQKATHLQHLAVCSYWNNPVPAASSFQQNTRVSRRWIGKLCPCNILYMLSLTFFSPSLSQTRSCLTTNWIFCLHPLKCNVIPHFWVCNFLSVPYQSAQYLISLSSFPCRAAVYGNVWQTIPLHPQGFETQWSQSNG